MDGYRWLLQSRIYGLQFLLYTGSTYGAIHVWFKSRRAGLDDLQWSARDRWLIVPSKMTNIQQRWQVAPTAPDPGGRRPFLLYVVLYSVIRNSNPFVDPSQTSDWLLRYMVIGLFIWFAVLSVFLFLKQYKETWDRGDYLSRYVIVSSITIVALLEYAVY